MLPDYAELHCCTNFSFLRGASHPGELVARAAELGYAALAITDECSLAGVVRAHVAAKAAGLKLIIGSEIVLADGMKLVLLAQNRAGYGNLSALITLGRRRATKADQPAGRRTPRPARRAQDATTSPQGAGRHDQPEGRRTPRSGGPERSEGWGEAPQVAVPSNARDGTKPHTLS